MTRSLGLGCLIALTFAARGSAQDPRLARLDAETRAAVAAILDSASAAGLPQEPLIDRALEGATKGAPGPIIIGAVRRLAADLGRARAVLRADATPAELEAAAAALRSGATPAAIARLRAERGDRALTVPLAVLADLVASGVPPDTAARAVVALAEQGDDRLVAFRQAVDRDIALGAPPATAASVRLNATAREDPSPQARRP
jgi:hypothetical protein